MRSSGDDAPSMAGGIGRRRLLAGIGGAAGLGLASNAAYCHRQSDTPAPDIGTIAKLSGILDAQSFGVTMSGRTDDSAALQAAIDAAHAARKMLLIPGGVALLGKPLRLQGRSVRLLGVGMDRTILRAEMAMDVMIDVRETEDKIVSPFEIEGLCLDGAGRVGTALAIRYRHHSVLRDMLCTSAGTGVRETDCWLSRRYNCRVERHRVGWLIERNGHSSLWEGCSFVECDETHLAIDTPGQGEPSSALTFRGCDVEFGRGTGIRIGKGVVAAFDNCYIGENIDGIVFDNAGLATVSGGVAFFGHTPASALVRPGDGTIRFQGVKVNGQNAGSLTNMVAPSNGPGKIDIRDITPAFSIAGDPTIAGRPLMIGTANSMVAAQGRNWNTVARGCMVDRAASGTAGVRLRCRTATATANTQFGASTPLPADRTASGRPVSAIVVYAASAPLTLQAVGVQTGSEGRQNAPAFIQVLGILPASTSERTYLKLDERLADRPFTHLEIVGPATSGNWMTLENVTLALRADATNATLNLAMAQ